MGLSTRTRLGGNIARYALTFNGELGLRVIRFVATTNSLLGDIGDNVGQTIAYTCALLFVTVCVGYGLDEYDGGVATICGGICGLVNELSLGYGNYGSDIRFFDDGLTILDGARGFLVGLYFIFFKWVVTRSFGSLRGDDFIVVFDGRRFINSVT